jgi:hypothetical protein
MTREWPTFQRGRSLTPDRQATSKGSGRALRGGRGQRASTDLSGTWETCVGGGGFFGTLRDRSWESITAIGPEQESEGVVVALKPGNSGGAKGPCRERVHGHGVACYMELAPTNVCFGITALRRQVDCGDRPSRETSAGLQRFSGKPCAGNPHARFDEGGGDW